MGGGTILDPAGLHDPDGPFALPDPIDLHGHQAKAVKTQQAAMLESQIALNNPAIDTGQTKDKQVTTTPKIDTRGLSLGSVSTTPITNTAASLGLQI